MITLAIITSTCMQAIYPVDIVCSVDLLGLGNIMDRDMIFEATAEPSDLHLNMQLIKGYVVPQQ